MTAVGFVGKHHGIVIFNHEKNSLVGFHPQFFIDLAVAERIDCICTVPLFPECRLVFSLLVKIFIPYLERLYPTDLHDVALQIKRQVLIIGMVACNFVVRLQLSFNGQCKIFHRATLIHER